MKLKQLLTVLTPTVESFNNGFKALVLLGTAGLFLWLLSALWPYILMAAFVVVLVSLTGKGSKHSREFGIWLKSEIKEMAGWDNTHPPKPPSNDNTDGGSI